MTSTTTDDEDSDPGDTSKAADNNTTPTDSPPSTSTPSNSSMTDSDTEELEDEEAAEVLLTPINFVDISGWYKEYIDSPIVTEIVETMVNSQTPFEDIAKKDWYFESVNWAKDKGYILGYDNKFMPNEFISRQDFAMIVERYINDLEASGLTVNVDLIDGAKFSDSEMISAYALNSVERIQSLGLVNGNHNLEFMPKKEISRGEGAKVFSLVFGMFE